MSFQALLYSEVTIGKKRYANVAPARLSSFPTDYLATHTCWEEEKDDEK